MASVVTPERYASGMSFGEYVSYIGSAENLAAWFGRTLRDRMRPVWPDLAVRFLSVGVEETPGQRGVWTLRE